MSDMEEKLGAILSDPNMMQQIMSMAQALGAGPSPPEPKPAQAELGLDPNLLRSLAGMAKGAAVDPNQRCLLDALCPYMSETRVHKLEKAMRAARLAGLASSFLNAGGSNMLAGR